MNNEDFLISMYRWAKRNGYEEVSQMYADLIDDLPAPQKPLKRYYIQPSIKELVEGFGSDAIISVYNNAIVEGNLTKIANIKRYYNFAIGNIPEVTDAMIDAARSVSIENTVRRYGISVKRGFITCPFHDDSTASMKLYPDTNTCYCFGCHKYSDSIGLVMHFTGMGFKDSVKELQ